MKSVQIKNKLLQIPIIQGGMGVGISLSSLAGNVMKQGAMGVLSAAHPGYKNDNFEKQSLQVNLKAIEEHVLKAREISENKGLLGINIMCASKDYEKYVKQAEACKVDCIISGAGLPLHLPSMISDHNILLAPIVSSGKAISLICRMWDKRYSKTPDFVVVEGVKAGGHLGFKEHDVLNETCESLEKILKDVKNEIKQFEEIYDKKIPVFVAGGIFDGKDIAKFLTLGADGVQMGTRFIPTYECDCDDKLKQAIILSEESDIKIVKSPTGFPGRALNNDFVKNLKDIIKITKCFNCLTPCNPSDTPYCISEALINAVKGDINKGLLFVGSNAHRIKEMCSVSALINELVIETKLELEKL